MEFEVSPRCRNSGVFPVQAPIDSVYVVMDRVNEARPAEPAPSKFEQFRHDSHGRRRGRPVKSPRANPTILRLGDRTMTAMKEEVSSDDFSRISHVPAAIANLPVQVSDVRGSK